MADELPVSSAFTFPRHRVQRLLNRPQYESLSTTVEAEAVFLLLGEDGCPVRQVFLAVTQRELLIVKQEIPEAVQVVCSTSDLEIADLAIDEILPLAVIRHLVLDDRTKFFCISTYCGKQYGYEMCQLDLESEQLWEKWRDRILCFGGAFTSNDVNTWTSYVIDIRQNLKRQSELTRSANGRSIGFGSVHYVGIQAEKGLETNQKYSAMNSIASGENMYVNSQRRFFDACHQVMKTTERPKRGKETKEVSDTISDRDTTSSSSSEYSLGGPWIGYRPSDRLGILFTGTKFVSRSDSKGLLQTNLRKSRSLNDLLDSQCQPWDMPNADSSLLAKLSKARQKVLSCKKNTMSELESSSESDDDLDNLFEEADHKKEHHKVGGRSARELWDLVRRTVVQKRKISMIERFQNVVHQIHFRILSNRDNTLAQSVTEFDPSGVSLQLTNISRKLFLAVSLRDLDIFTQSRGKEIGRALEEMLKFSEDIRKMVITEITKSDSRPGSVRVLKLFVQVAVNLLFRHSDFHSLVAVLRGLTSLPLYRMANMWATFFIQEAFSFCHFLTMIQLLNPMRHQAAYVSRVNTCMKRKSPYIPLLDHILEHCLERTHFKKENLDSLQSGHGKWNKSEANESTSLLRPINNESAPTGSLLGKKHSFNKQKKTDNYLKPILLNKEKRRNSITNMLFGGKKKRKKLRVTFQSYCDIEERRLKERNMKESCDNLLKHLTEARINMADKIKVNREDNDTDNDPGSSDDNGERDRTTSGNSSRKTKQRQKSSLTSIYARFTRSPVLMQYCDFQAKSILNLTLKEVKDLMKHSGDSADSDNYSSRDNKSSLIDIPEKNGIPYEYDVTALNAVDKYGIDKTYPRSDNTKEKCSEENLPIDVPSQSFEIASGFEISSKPSTNLHEDDKTCSQKDITNEANLVENSSFNSHAQILHTSELDISRHFASDEPTGGENKMDRRSASVEENKVKDPEKENIKEATFTESKSHNASESTRFKAKKSEKGKFKQKSSKSKKRPFFLKKLKVKFGKWKKADIKHINALQKDIDEIENLMSSFKAFNEDTDKHETTGHTNSENNDDIETDINTLPGTLRRKSYVPGIAEMGRRKSMFEEAIAANKEEEEEKETALFESLKNNKLDRLKKRGSIALALLTPDEDDLKDDTIDNTSKISLIESLTNLFRSNNKSNNSMRDTANNKHFELSKRHLKHIHLTRSLSELGQYVNSKTDCKSLRSGICSKPCDVSLPTRQNDLNQNSINSKFDLVSSKAIQSVRNKGVSFVNDSIHNGCSLCGKNRCLYESGIGKYVLNVQANLVKVAIPSRQRVKECFKSIIMVNNYLSDFDILQLSLYSE